MNDEKKKLVSRWDWIWLVVVGFIFLYILLSKFGIHMAYHSETTEMISNTKDGGKRIHSPGKTTVIETLSDYDLKQIADSYAEKTMEDLSYYGLDREQVVFYERIYEAYDGNPKIEDARDWLNVLRKVQSTYTNLGDIYRAHKVKKEPNKAVFSDIENVFGVSEASCKRFAQSEGGDMLDWALFIEAAR